MKVVVLIIITSVYIIFNNFPSYYTIIMELDSLVKTVSILQKYGESKSRIQSLQQELDEKNSYIMTLEAKLKAFTDNSQLKSYIKGLEENIIALQRKIEKLEIVISNKIKDSENILAPDRTNSSSVVINKPSCSLHELFKETKIWSSIQNFLTSEDIIGLFLVSNKVKCELAKKCNVFAYILRNIPVPKLQIAHYEEVKGLLKE